MEELHAAIADYLRTMTPQGAPQVDEHPLRGLSTSRGTACCRICGKPIIADEGPFRVEKLLADRACADHYLTF